MPRINQTIDSGLLELGGKRQTFEAKPSILKQFWQYLSKNRGAVAPLAKPVPTALEYDLDPPLLIVRN